MVSGCVSVCQWVRAGVRQNGTKVRDLRACLCLCMRVCLSVSAWYVHGIGRGQRALVCRFLRNLYLVVGGMLCGWSVGAG